MYKQIKFILIFALFLILQNQTLLAKEAYLALDFRLPDLNQNTINLSEYKDKQPVLLFFWTTWCPFCLRQLKVLNDKSEEIRGYDLEVLAINIGENPNRVARFAKINRLFFKVLLDLDNTVAESYGILGVPTYILVDKSGRVIYQDNTFPPYKKLLKR